MSLHYGIPNLYLIFLHIDISTYVWYTSINVQFHIHISIRNTYVHDPDTASDLHQHILAQKIDILSWQPKAKPCLTFE